MNQYCWLGVREIEWGQKRKLSGVLNGFEEYKDEGKSPPPGVGEENSSFFNEWMVVTYEREKRKREERKDMGREYYELLM